MACFMLSDRSLGPKTVLLTINHCLHICKKTKLNKTCSYLDLILHIWYSLMQSGSVWSNFRFGNMATFWISIKLIWNWQNGSSISFLLLPYRSSSIILPEVFHMDLYQTQLISGKWHIGIKCTGTGTHMTELRRCLVFPYPCRKTAPVKGHEMIVDQSISHTRKTAEPA